MDGGSWACSKMVRQVHKTKPPPTICRNKIREYLLHFFVGRLLANKRLHTGSLDGSKKRRKNKPYINEVVLERVSRMRLKKKSLPLAPRFSISFAGQMSWTSVATRAAGPRPLGRPELQLIYLSLDTMLQLYRVYTYSYLTEQQTMLIVGMPNRVKNSSNQGDAICSFTLFYSNQFLWAAVPNL